MTRLIAARKKQGTATKSKNKAHATNNTDATGHTDEDFDPNNTNGYNDDTNNENYHNGDYDEEDEELGIDDVAEKLKNVEGMLATLLKRRPKQTNDNVLNVFSSALANVINNTTQGPLANLHRTENQTLEYNARAVESEQSSYGIALNKAFIRHDPCEAPITRIEQLVYDETSGVKPRADNTIEAIMRLTRSRANLGVALIVTEAYAVDDRRAAEDMGLKIFQAEGFKTLPQSYCQAFAYFFRANDAEFLKASPTAGKRNVTRNLVLFLAYPTCDCSDLDDPSNPLGRYRGADDWAINLFALLCAFHHCVRTIGSGSSTSSFGLASEQVRSAMAFVGRTLCLFHNAANCCFRGTDTSVILATAAAVKYNKALGSTFASDSGANNFADESDEKCRGLIEAAKIIAFPQGGRRERSPASGASATGTAPPRPEGRGPSARVNDPFTEAAKKIFVNHVDYGNKALPRLAGFLRKHNTTVRPSADSQVGQWLAQCEAAPRSGVTTTNNNNNRNQRQGTTNGGLLATPSGARS